MVSKALYWYNNGIYNVSGRDEASDPEVRQRRDGGFPYKTQLYYA